MLMGAIFADAMGRDVMPDVYPQPAANAAEMYTGLLLRAIGVENGSPKRRVSRQTNETTFTLNSVIQNFRAASLDSAS